MKIRIPRSAPAVAISVIALFAALGGTGYAAVTVANSFNSKHLGGQPPSYYLPSHDFVSSHGARFLSAGQTTTLGEAGHFTFSAECTRNSAGETVVAFDVTANTTADLDGNGPSAAGTKVTIHEDSDAMDSTTETPLKNGDFAQVGSASSSTEIAADGEEADIFYNDGVNWPAGNGSRAHDCFAGYTGFLAHR